MKSPIKRKKTERHCPINVDSLYRRWFRGDKRINWKLISKLLDRWECGEYIPWRKLSHTFIKAGPRPRRRTRNRRQNQEPREHREHHIFDITQLFDDYETTADQE